MGRLAGNSLPIIPERIPMFSDKERELLEKLREDKPGYPFNLTNSELEMALHAVKRERGSSEDEARRLIRVFVARRFKWNFALDGGFMTNEGKHWPTGGWPFAKSYLLFENLALYLLNKEGWSLEQIDEIVSNPRLRNPV
jgi:hypothetical protein